MANVACRIIWYQAFGHFHYPCTCTYHSAKLIIRFKDKILVHFKFIQLMNIDLKKQRYRYLFQQYKIVINLAFLPDNRCDL